MKRTYTHLMMFLLFMISVYATVVASNNLTLYRAELPIISAESEPSADELKMALAQVLSNLTNVQDIDKDPTWTDSLNHAKDWMLSYQYIPASNGNPLTLQVDFDPNAISQLLKSKGKNVPTATASSQRLLVWLVVQNDGPQQLLGSASAYAKTIATVAQQKSINLEWPLLDLADLKALSASQAWSGDWSSIDAASKRYAHDGILLIHLNPGQGAQSLWASEWTLKTGIQNVDWVFSANNAAGALQGGMQQLSSIMTQGAKPSGTTVSEVPLPVRKVEVVVYGIGDVSALDGLKNSLQQLTPVQDIEVVEVSPDEVILNLNVQGGSAALQQAINDQIMTLAKTQSTDPNIPSDALIYQWAS